MGEERVMISRKPERAFGQRHEEAEPDRSSDNRGTYDDRLASILTAATDLIARVGYGNASMRAVARASGVSLAGLYHYFDSKEKMLFIIQFRAFNLLANTIREKLHGVSDPVERLRIVVRTHVDYFAGNMAALKVCSHELDSLTGAAYEETRRLRYDIYGITRDIVRDILEANDRAEALDAHVATMSLFGTLNWLYRWYDPKRSRSAATVANQISRQFLRGVLGSADSG
jgi:AcrR family transcriptional regulator